MTPRSDPYRVLGLVPGATPGEVRSAYRRLAKMHHPDTAGERSLARFLAIKAAYEELVDTDGRLRARGGPAGAGGSTTARGGSPNAKGASRDAWRARQGNGAPGAKAGGGSRATGSDDGGAKAGPRAEDDARAGAEPNADAGGPGTSPKESSSGSGAGAGTNAGERSNAGARTKRRARADGAKSSGGSARGGMRGKSAERRTARPGSTTYDEATLGLDPAWDGARWYGASSGSYWTLNPREYADPRKHGPEYQERARRATKLEAQLRARRVAEAAADSGRSSTSGSATSDDASAPATEMPPASSATAEPDDEPRDGPT